MKRQRKVLTVSVSWLKWPLMAVLAYGLALAFLVFFQRSFLYFPNDSYLSPQQAGQASLFEEMEVKTEDGLVLKGWYSPPTTRTQTIVFFHGNADSVHKASFIADPYRRAGYGFLIAEYRGYSGFKGKPTEEGLYADGRAFTRAARALVKGPRDVILFGHSLGSGVAVQMATEFPEVGGVMLLSPIFSTADMAQHRFPYFPSKIFVKDRFANNEKIGQLQIPILMVHGEADKIIPFKQGKALFDLAPDPKEFHAVPGGGHNDLFEEPFSALSLRWLNALSENPGIYKKPGFIKYK